jgi:hypothetical protein
LARPKTRWTTEELGDLFAKLKPADLATLQGVDGPEALAERLRTIANPPPLSRYSLPALTGLQQVLVAWDDAPSGMRADLLEDPRWLAGHRILLDFVLDRKRVVALTLMVERALEQSTWPSGSEAPPPPPKREKAQRAKMSEENRLLAAERLRKAREVRQANLAAAREAREAQERALALSGVGVD